MSLVGVEKRGNPSDLSGAKTNMDEWGLPLTLTAIFDYIENYLPTNENSLMVWFTLLYRIILFPSHEIAIGPISSTDRTL